MSSSRFPGKVLAPLAGRPVLWWVIERVSKAVERSRIVLATSSSGSDDPLAAYAGSLGIAVFRGELDDVVARFQACLRAHPADWFVRICADSPLVDPGLIRALAAKLNPALDLVTNVQVRTFPRGQSVEFVRSGTFAALDSKALSAEEREHATLVFYRNPEKFRIENVVGQDPAWSNLSYTVDSIENLRAVETILKAGALPAFAPRAAP